MLCDPAMLAVAILTSPEAVAILTSPEAVAAAAGAIGDGAAGGSAPSVADFHASSDASETRL